MIIGGGDPVVCSARRRVGVTFGTRRPALLLLMPPEPALRPRHGALDDAAMVIAEVCAAIEEVVEVVEAAR